MCAHFIALISVRYSILNLLLNPPSVSSFIVYSFFSSIENVAHLVPLISYTSTCRIKGGVIGLTLFLLQGKLATAVYRL